jgi:histidine triad (HIT) family protein
VSIAAGLGFEPRYLPPEGNVLPLDDPAMFSEYLKTDSKSKTCQVFCNFNYTEPVFAFSRLSLYNKGTMKYSEFLESEVDKPCRLCATKAEEKIMENETAFLTFALAPYHPDHLLAVPKRHIEHILDLTDQEMADLDHLQERGWAMLKKLGYKSVSFVVREGENSGRTVGHIHYHIIPDVRVGDIDHNGDLRKIMTPAEISGLLDKFKKLA